MILLLTGEGPTDMGRSATEKTCQRNNFQPGPMAHLIDQLLAPVLGYSQLEYATQEDCNEMLHFVPKGHLKHLDERDPKSLRFRSLKGVQGTGFHFKLAEVLGLHAQKIEAEHDGDQVIAVFFRDADSTNTTPRTEWQEKWNSILDGFAEANFERGVPMLPKPKSEAWLLCALGNNYQYCEALEDAPGNDASPNSLKSQLEVITGGRELEPIEIEANRIEMPSFNAFKTRLNEVVQSI